MKKKPQTVRLVRHLGGAWEEWLMAASPSRTDASSPQGGDDAILAVPARSVVVAPIWINAVDSEIVRNSIALELEVRGLLPRKSQADVAFSRTLVSGERTLVVAKIFTPALPADVVDQVFDRYEASPALLDLESDSVTLWREGDDMVAAFTRGKQIVYWATHDAGEDGLGAWVQALILHLLALGILEKAPSRFCVGEGIEHEPQALEDLRAARLGMAISSADLRPSLEHGRFEWKPEQALHAERKSLSLAKIRSGLKVLAGAYLVAGLLGGAYFGWLTVRENRLKARVAVLEKQAGSFEPVIQAWQTVGPSAEPQTFPLEILHFVVQDMPRNGLRLTAYDLTGGRVVLEGEATSASLVSQFFGSISQEAGLADFRWEMPPPALLPNNAARFHITGAAQ